LAGISLLGAKLLGFLDKMTPKTSNEKKTLAGRALPRAKLRLLSHWAWNYLYPFGLCWCARKKGQEGRWVTRGHISRMCGATRSWRIPTKLGKCVCLTVIIKRAKFHRYNLRDFGAVRCWSFHVAIGNQGHMTCLSHLRRGGKMQTDAVYFHSQTFQMPVWLHFLGPAILINHYIHHTECHQPTESWAKAVFKSKLIRHDDIRF